MSDDRGPEFGELGEGDFGVGEEEREEFGAINEARERDENEYGQQEGVHSVKDLREPISVSSSNKRAKEMSIDRLSALPNSLLIHILSQLDSGEAATLAVLSRRWQYLWTELPALDFWETQKPVDFVPWVHRTLLLRSGIYLERFRVFFRYNNCFASDVNAWVHFAVKHKVKELDLMLQSEEHFYMLPQALFCNSSLTSLFLERCILAPRRTIEWQSLSHLRIKSVELCEDVIQNILSGCPVLYSLNLSRCWGFKFLEVNSRSLVSLGVSVCGDKMSKHLVEISAPYIKMLDISLHPSRTKMQLNNIPSVTDADVNYTVPHSSVEVMNNTMELLEMLQHVKVLVLGYGVIEVLSEMVVHGWRLPESKQDCLVIDTWRDGDSIPAIVGLLESSSKLDTLVVQCCDSYEESVTTWGPPVKDDLVCDLLHLKVVRFIGYANPYLAGEPMLTLARILLKRATALEKMVIDKEEDLTNFPSDVSKIVGTVLSYSRSSEKAIVVLHE
ncbi:unnamed protein product [Cuscuta epithymum]|uniref:F-box domain-containing protein n=1 Tax=Cuscuta epithymum TaxID=186058 RepID=A0AAV0GAZ3_9ASTE|nr:unnamed protein product [Cuscuta epithymum]